MAENPNLTRTQVLAICETGDFTRLIGAVENVEFDCKMQPYQLDDDKGKLELAKDVSAFANAGGGVILLGVKTEASADHFGDEVVCASPFAQNLVNPIKYADLLNAWVYPAVAGLTVKWKASANDAGKGVVTIDIPPQPNDIKPFLIAKTQIGTKTVESMFGYAVRKGETSPPLGVKELQQHLNSGLTYDTNIDARLSAIETILQALVGNTHQEAQVQAQATQLTAAVTATLEHGDLKDRLVLILSAQPSVKTRLRSLFASGPGTLKDIVEHPPTLRSSGWTVETLDTAKIVQGKFIRVTNGARKVLDLYADGTMAFAVSADQDFLAWGKRSAYNINPLALIEVVYSFMVLYAKVLENFPVTPDEVHLSVGLRGMRLNGDYSLLGPGEINSIAQQAGFETKEAPAESLQESYDEEAATFDPEIAAYEIVRLVYLWFGLSDSVIPYTYQKGERHAICTARIAMM
jgi:hypothetical protein